MKIKKTFCGSINAVYSMDDLLAMCQEERHPRIKWRGRSGSATLSCGSREYDIEGLVDTSECYLEFQAFLKKHNFGVSRYEFTKNVPAPKPSYPYWEEENI